MVIARPFYPINLSLAYLSDPMIFIVQKNRHFFLDGTFLGQIGAMSVVESRQFVL